MKNIFKNKILICGFAILCGFLSFSSLLSNKIVVKAAGFDDFATQVLSLRLMSPQIEGANGAFLYSAQDVGTTWVSETPLSSHVTTGLDFFFYFTFEYIGTGPEPTTSASNFFQGTYRADNKYLTFEVAVGNDMVESKVFYNKFSTYLSDFFVPIPWVFYPLRVATSISNVMIGFRHQTISATTATAQQTFFDTNYRLKLMRTTDIGSVIANWNNSEVATAYDVGYNAGYQAGMSQDLNQVYNTGYNAGYQAGLGDHQNNTSNYDKGYTIGFDIGYNSGYTAGLAMAGEEFEGYYNDGYNTGYNVGYTTGSSDNGNVFSSLLFSAFSSVGTILSIELLPGIAIGTIILVPIVFSIIYFVIGRKKE